MANKRIEAVLSNWASELGIAIQTIQRKLSKHDIDFEVGDKITAREIFRSLYDAREEALTRQAIAEAEAMERENKEADRLLVSFPDAEKKLWGQVLLPLKTEVDLAADKLASLVNPDNPDLAHKVITDWSEQIKKQIKENEPKSVTPGLQKPETKKGKKK